MATSMKKVVKKAAKFESKKSLDGPMKFLKGNAGTHVMPNGKVMKNSAHKKTKK
jgi:hypothetical protein